MMAPENVPATDTMVIDARVHLPRPGGQPGRSDPNLNSWFKQPTRFRDGGTLDDMIAEMDGAGVDRAVLVTAPGLSPLDGRGQGPFAVSSGYDDATFDALCEEIAEPVGRYVERFVGVVMLDPMGGRSAVEQLRRAVKEFGFRGCAIMPALIGVPPDDQVYAPIYSTCLDLGIPITINLGTPGPSRSSLTQQPASIERVLLGFPELRLAACHVGHPWHDEVVWMLERFEHFHLITSAWAPKYLPSEIVSYMQRTDSDRVMWATDYPLLAFDRSLGEARALDLAPAARRSFLAGAAERLYWDTK